MLNWWRTVLFLTSWLLHVAGQAAAGHLGQGLGADEHKASLLIAAQSHDASSRPGGEGTFNPLPTGQMS